MFEKYFPNEYETSEAKAWIIYLLDLGRFLWTADVCVANLDEPTDPGVLVEVMFAHMMGKPVLGYRTEARSPYGTLSDFTTGMHFFKFFPLDAFLSLTPASIPNGKALDEYCDKVA